jgi:hypothetical protein
MRAQTQTSASKTRQSWDAPLLCINCKHLIFKSEKCHVFHKQAVLHQQSSLVEKVINVVFPEFEDASECRKNKSMCGPNAVYFE